MDVDVEARRKPVVLMSPLPHMYMVPDEAIAPIYLYLDRTSMAGPPGPLVILTNNQSK